MIANGTSRPASGSTRETDDIDRFDLQSGAVTSPLAIQRVLVVLDIGSFESISKFQSPIDLGQNHRTALRMWQIEIDDEATRANVNKGVVDLLVEPSMVDRHADQVGSRRCEDGFPMTVTIVREQ